MDNDRTDEILEKLNALEKKLEDISIRVYRLEQPAPQPVQPQRPVTPPPVQEAHFQQQYFQQPQLRPAYEPPRYQPPPKREPPKPPTGLLDGSNKPPQGHSAEYVIGAKILPKVGAILMLLAITFTVILAYRRGFITPAMMFGIEVAFCSALIVTGIVKRDLKEEFGQILTGIGSCGLYLVFLGGHLYYHLYPGETLIALCCALSFAILGYSLWRSSRSFYSLGLIGGLVTASVLPNLQSDHSIINAWIHFLILIPAALIAAKNKWMEMTVWLWVASTAALSPIYTNGLPWTNKVAIFDATTVICFAAYGWSYKKWEFDPGNVLPAVALWFTGFVGLMLNYQRPGVWQFAGFFALFGLLALAFWKKPAMRNILLVGAIGVPITLAPMCFRGVQTAQIYAVISIVAAILARWRLPKTLSSAALVEFFLGTMFYVGAATSSTIPWQTETGVLALFVVSVILTGSALIKAYGNEQVVMLGGMALAIPYVMRVSVLDLGQPSVNFRPEFSVAICLLFFTYYTLIVLAIKKWRSSLIVFWFLYCVAILAYIAAATLISPGSELPLIGFLMLAPVTSVLLPGASKSEGTIALAWMIVGGFLVRVGVIAGPPLLHWSPALSCAVSAFAVSTACFITMLVNRKAYPAAAGYVYLILAYGQYAFGDNRFTQRVDLLVISALLAGLVLAGRATAPLLAKSRGEFAILLSILGWGAFSQWAVVALNNFIPSLTPLADLSIAWSAYFLGLIALGFAYRMVQFRYASFVVLGATLTKILLVDLANTDALIRVAVLFVSATIILGVSGWWYVRVKEKPAAASDS